MGKRPKRKITHVFEGKHVRGAICVKRVPFQLGDLRIMVACGWPRSVHPEQRKR